MPNVQRLEMAGRRTRFGGTGGTPYTSWTLPKLRELSRRGMAWYSYDKKAPLVRNLRSAVAPSDARPASLSHWPSQHPRKYNIREKRCGIYRRRLRRSREPVVPAAAQHREPSQPCQQRRSTASCCLGIPLTSLLQPALWDPRTFFILFLFVQDKSKTMQKIHTIQHDTKPSVCNIFSTLLRGYNQPWVSTGLGGGLVSTVGPSIAHISELNRLCDTNLQNYSCDN